MIADLGPNGVDDDATRDSETKEATSYFVGDITATEEEAHFITGSSYKGSWDTLGMAGVGRYVMPNGAAYEGEIRDGMFHGRGTLYWPEGQRLDVVHHRGELLEHKYTFADGLPYRDVDWSYCSFPDRRFYESTKRGLRPAGRTLRTAKQPTKVLPSGCYDAGDGVFDPKTLCITSYDDSAKILRTATKEECDWIVNNCRKSWTEPTGYRESLIENWSDDPPELPYNLAMSKDSPDSWWKRLTTFERDVVDDGKRRNGSRDQFLQLPELCLCGQYVILGEPCHCQPVSQPVPSEDKWQNDADESIFHQFSSEYAIGERSIEGVELLSSDEPVIVVSSNFSLRDSGELPDDSFSGKIVEKDWRLDKKSGNRMEDHQMLLAAAKTKSEGEVVETKKMIGQTELQTNAEEKYQTRQYSSSKTIHEENIGNKKDIAEAKILQKPSIENEEEDQHPFSKTNHEENIENKKEIAEAKNLQKSSIENQEEDQHQSSKTNHEENIENKEEIAEAKNLQKSSIENQEEDQKSRDSMKQDNLDEFVDKAHRIKIARRDEAAEKYEKVLDPDKIENQEDQNSRWKDLSEDEVLQKSEEVDKIIISQLEITAENEAKADENDEVKKRLEISSLHNYSDKSHDNWTEKSEVVDAEEKTSVLAIRRDTTMENRVVDYAAAATIPREKAARAAELETEADARRTLKESSTKDTILQENPDKFSADAESIGKISRRDLPSHQAASDEIVARISGIKINENINFDDQDHIFSGDFAEKKIEDDDEDKKISDEVFDNENDADNLRNELGKKELFAEGFLVPRENRSTVNSEARKSQNIFASSKDDSRSLEKINPSSICPMEQKPCNEKEIVEIFNKFPRKEQPSNKRSNANVWRLSSELRDHSSGTKTSCHSCRLQRRTNAIVTEDLRPGLALTAPRSRPVEYGRKPRDLRVRKPTAQEVPPVASPCRDEYTFKIPTKPDRFGVKHSRGEKKSA